MQLLRGGVQATVIKVLHATDTLRQRGNRESIQPLKVSIRTLAVSAMERPITALAHGLRYQSQVLQVTDMPTVREVHPAVRPAEVKT